MPLRLPDGVHSLEWCFNFFIVVYRGADFTTGPSTVVWAHNAAVPITRMGIEAGRPHRYTKPPGPVTPLGIFN